MYQIISFSSSVFALRSPFPRKRRKMKRQRGGGTRCPFADQNAQGNFVFNELKSETMKNVSLE